MLIVCAVSCVFRAEKITHGPLSNLMAEPISIGTSVGSKVVDGVGGFVRRLSQVRTDLLDIDTTKKDGTEENFSYSRHEQQERTDLENIGNKKVVV